jgi:hypothetical protein
MAKFMGVLPFGPLSTHTSHDGTIFDFENLSPIIFGNAKSTMLSQS